MSNFYGLPDGTRMPLEIPMPDAGSCHVGDTRRCQVSEGMRQVGYRDTETLPKDKNGEELPEIRAVFPGKSGVEYRMRFRLTLPKIRPIANFDANQAVPAGTIFELPRPEGVRPVVPKGRRSKPRRDAGMSKAEADRRFNRVPGAHAGRRAHEITTRFADAKSVLG